MSKNISRKLLAILLCLAIVFTLGMLMIACDPDEEETEEPELEVSDYVNQTLDKLDAYFTVDGSQKYAVDLKADLDISKIAGNAFVDKYELIVKGNVDPNTDDAFRVELNRVALDGARTNILGIYYETEGANEFYYLSIMGQTNKFDGAELNTLVTDLMAQYNINGDFIKGIATLVLPMLFETATVENNVYTYTFNTKTFIANIDPLLSLISLPDIDLKQILSIIPNADITATFAFDAANNFTGFDMVIDAHLGDENSGATDRYDLSIPTVYFGNDRTVTADEGYFLDADARANETVNNMLNFKFDMGLEMSGSLYELTFNADLNPVPLIKGLINQESALNFLDKLGYIDFQMKRVRYGETDISDNPESILTLVADFNNMQMIFGYLSPGVNSNNVLELQGSYELESFINMLMYGVSDGKYVEPSEPGETPETPETPEEGNPWGVTFETLLMDTILGNLNFSDLFSTGTIVYGADESGAVQNLAFDIAKLLNQFDENSEYGGDVANIVLGNIFAWEYHKLTMTLGDFTLGSAEIAGLAELDFPGTISSIGDKLIDVNTDVLELVDPSTFQTVYENKEDFTFYPNKGIADTYGDKTFEIRAKDIYGNIQVYPAYYYGITGFDSTKSGTQTVTVYFGINSLLSKYLSNPLLGGRLPAEIFALPLSGLMTMEIEVYVNEGNVFSISGNESIMADMDAAAQLNGTYTITNSDGKTYQNRITSDMLSVKEDSDGTLFVNGRFTKYGVYTLVVNYSNYSAEHKVVVSQLLIDAKSNYITPGTSIKDLIELSLVTPKNDGTDDINEVALNIDNINFTITGAIRNGFNDKVSALFTDATSNATVIWQTGSTWNNAGWAGIPFSYEYNGETFTASVRFSGYRRQNVVSNATIKAGSTVLGTVRYFSDMQSTEVTAETYNIYYDATKANKLRVAKEDGTLHPQSDSFVIELAQIGDFDFATRKITKYEDEARKTVPEFEIWNAYGKFNIKLSLGAFAEENNYKVATDFDVKPVFMLNTSASTVTLITSMFSSITTNLTTADYIKVLGNGVTGISYKFENVAEEGHPASYKLNLYYTIKEGDVSVEKLVTDPTLPVGLQNKIKFDVSFEIWDAAAQTPGYVSTDGKSDWFSVDSVNRYLKVGEKYRITINYKLDGIHSEDQYFTFTVDNILAYNATNSNRTKVGNIDNDVVMTDWIGKVA